MTNRLGIIARADRRGLAYLTLEATRHLRPARVLLLEVPESPFPFEPDAYQGLADDVHVITWNPARPGLGDTTVARFLDGLDVLYSAETFYDPAIPQEATRRGIRNVLHVMPEFARSWAPAHVEEWLPTSWRRHLHPLAPIVPVPCVLPPVTPSLLHPERLVVLHVAGNRAAGDRNGTEVLTRLLGHLSPDARFTLRIAIQRGARPKIGDKPRGVTVEYLEDASDRWRMYEGAHVLLLPRRYGGLCLPVLEGCAAGLVPVLPDVSPNEDYPAVRTKVPSTAGHLKTSGGMLPMAEPDETSIAAVLEGFLAEPSLLDAARYTARAWAEAHSWPRLLPTYRDLLGLRP